MKELYADIILPLPADGLFSYKVPHEMADYIVPGTRVIVPFGSKKFYSGIIRKIHDSPPEGFKIREIESVMDPFPIVNNFQFEFWEWISAYYLCTPGEVMKAALPSGLKAESRTNLRLSGKPVKNPDLTTEENRIMDVISVHKGITVSDLKKRTGIRNIERWVNLLILKEMILSEERMEEKYKPKTRMYIRLSQSFLDENNLRDLINSLKKRKRQSEFLEAFIREWNLSGDRQTGLSRQTIQELPGFSQGILRSLINRKILEINNKIVSRLESDDVQHVREPRELTPVQVKALNEINRSFNDGKVALLHGITSSGKTEIYFHLIHDKLRQGKQVLYLLPEIVLTSQIVRRLKEVFGNQVGIYHSRYSDAERVETWYNLVRDQDDHSLRIILGARSAVFLPFSNLGLIIVDEEHENTYKQSEPAPRYHARDAAIILASIHNASVVLGTATPSFESYHNALDDKYRLVELNERYSQKELPEIRVVNIRELYRKKIMRSHFSDQLLEEAKKTLNEKQQVILFQNRRGFSPYIKCLSCGWIPYCKKCDVSLVYHKQRNQLVCHYCGYSIRTPGECPECKDSKLSTRGFGTEQIEEELNIFIPGAAVQRFDLDTARSGKQYEEIIRDFERRKTNVLVGTQIISKGLDFDNVGLVGILNADNLLNYPDFRAYERSYQLLSQVAGRAGRKYGRGVVIIQTSDPENAVIRNVMEQDFRSFYEAQMTERKAFNYPPFFRLINISLRHRHPDILNEIAEMIGKELGKIPDVHILGPQQPVVGKIKNWHIQSLMIKLPKKRYLNINKERIQKIIRHYNTYNKFRGIQFLLDVDPF